VSNVFEAAKQNAPSIIFIDDTDVIFEDADETGLHRYLLTMLDGLESESAARVCVMMTAMDVGSCRRRWFGRAGSSCGSRHGCRTRSAGGDSARPAGQAARRYRAADPARLAAQSTALPEPT